MRNKAITVFVCVWLVLFNYESCRAWVLNPLFKKDLPKVKFLFPPAGWVMFYKVDQQYGMAEVFGVRQGQPQWIDPHDILRTRPIGYDNVHRNALVSVLEPPMQKSFCDFLRWRFSQYDSFMVMYVQYEDVLSPALSRRQVLAYECR